VPLLLDAAGAALHGARISEAAAREAVTAALAGLEFLADTHASAGYRRRAATALAVRAILDACAAAERRSRAH
jgi:CO/xanthine dehydrogenase FAD-binding subunit